MSTIHSDILKGLREYLNSTPVEERKVLWAQVRSLGIKGPTVAEYLDQVQEELGGYNNSFAARPLIFESFHSFETAIMDAEIVQWIASCNHILKDDSWPVAGESSYCMAA